MRRLTLAVPALIFFVLAAPRAQLRVAAVGEHPGDVSLELQLRKLASTGTFMETDARLP